MKVVHFTLQIRLKKTRIMYFKYNDAVIVQSYFKVLSIPY